MYIPNEIIEILERHNTKVNRLVLHNPEVCCSKYSSRVTKVIVELNNALSEIQGTWSVGPWDVYPYQESSGEFKNSFKRFVLFGADKYAVPHTCTMYDLLTGKKLFTILEPPHPPKTGRIFYKRKLYCVVAKTKEEYVPLGESKFFLEKEDPVSWKTLVQHILVCADAAEERGALAVSELLRYLAKDKNNVHKFFVPIED
jgi:hypothetical protein